MCSVIKCGAKAHDDACLAALNTLQGALPGAGNNQASVNALFVAFHRSIIAPAKANNNSSGIGPSLDALRSLGFQS